MQARTGPDEHGHLASNSSVSIPRPIHLILDSGMACHDVVDEFVGDLGWSPGDLIGRRVLGLLVNSDGLGSSQPFVARVGARDGSWRWVLIEVRRAGSGGWWHVHLHSEMTGPWSSEARDFVREHDADTGLLNGEGARVRVGLLQARTRFNGGHLSLAILTVAQTAMSDSAKTSPEVVAMLVAPSMHRVARASFVARIDEVTLVMGFEGLASAELLVKEAEEARELIEHDVRYIDPTFTVDMRVVFDARGETWIADLDGDLTAFLSMEDMSA